MIINVVKKTRMIASYINISIHNRGYQSIINIFVSVTWVITDGVFGSIAEVISNGMRGYAEAYGLSKLQVIGLAPWRQLSFHSQLHSSDYSVGHSSIWYHFHMQAELT